MLIKNALASGNLQLRDYSKSPQLDSEVLLCFVLNKSREHLLTYVDKKISTKQLKKFNKYIKQRVKNKPIAYITGVKEFYNREFIVNKNVLVPRPDTEIIIDYLLEKNKKAIYLDIGTGSGVIAITLKKELKNKNNNSKIIASDISKKALKLAKKNAKKLSAKIKFLHGNLWKPFEKSLKKPKNVIVIANLPYLEKKYIINDLKFEPKKALYASNKGLDLYKKLLKQIKNSKIKPSIIALEALPEQIKHLEKLAKKYFKSYTTSLLSDLGGQNRYIILEK